MSRLFISLLLARSTCPSGRSHSHSLWMRQWSWWLPQTNNMLQWPLVRMSPLCDTRLASTPLAPASALCPVWRRWRRPGQAGRNYQPPPSPLSCSIDMHHPSASSSPFFLSLTQLSLSALACRPLFLPLARSLPNAAGLRRLKSHLDRYPAQVDFYRIHSDYLIRASPIRALVIDSFRPQEAHK